MVSIGVPFMLLTMSIADFEDKNDIAQSSGPKGQTSSTAHSLFEMNEKLYLLQLNESVPTIDEHKLLQFSLKSFSGMNN